MIYRNPVNNFTKEINPFEAYLGTLFLGPLYLLWHGAWFPALIVFFLITPVLLVMGLAYLPLLLIWVFLAMLGPGIIGDTYQDKGWIADDPRKRTSDSVTS